MLGDRHGHPQRGLRITEVPVATRTTFENYVGPPAAPINKDAVIQWFCCSLCGRRWCHLAIKRGVKVRLHDHKCVVHIFILGV